MKIHFATHFGVVLVFIVVIFSVSGCKATFEKIGKNVGRGVVKGIKSKDSQLDSLVDGIVSNLREKALGDSTRLKIDSLLAAVTYKLRNSADSLTNSVRDSLLSEYTGLKIKKIVLEAGDGLKSTTSDLREELLGVRTKFLISQIKNDLLGDSTILAVAKIRNELLGQQTKILVDSLLASSLATISEGLENKIGPQIKGILKDTEDTAKGTVKYIAWALGVLVVILVLVTGFFWRKFSTRKKILRILTQEIDQIDSQEQYDNLVTKIKQRTTSENLEASFQEILKKEKLHQQDEWIDKDKQLLKELTENLDEKLSKSDVEELRSKLEEKGLNDHLDSVKKRY